MLGDVNWKDERLAAVPLDLAGRCLESPSPPRKQRDLRALGREPPRRRTPDPAGRSRDDDYLAPLGNDAPLRYLSVRSRLPR